MELPIWIVDAFTDRPFAGNPAAVCLAGKPLAEETMRRVAAEMNLSETAFPVPEGESFRLRWFTPKVEVDLCGHATLASSHVLWSEGFLPPARPIARWSPSERLGSAGVPSSPAGSPPAAVCCGCDSPGNGWPSPARQSPWCAAGSFRPAELAQMLVPHNPFGLDNPVIVRVGTAPEVKLCAGSNTQTEPAPATPPA